MVKVLSPNDLLLDQTMLCEASRLFVKSPQEEAFISYLEGFHKPGNDQVRYYGVYDKSMPSNTERLFNLSLLLDGLALHDHLYVLKAELPLDAATLQLRQHLIQKGIVVELDTVPYASRIKQEFSTFFSHLHSSPEFSTFSKWARLPSEMLEEYTKVIQMALDSFLTGNGKLDQLNDRDNERLGAMLEVLNHEYEGSLFYSKTRHWKQQPFLTLWESILENVAFYPSGSIVDGTSFLRTFIYWRVSEHAKIPLFPSSRRIPQLDAFASHIRLHTAEKIYQVIADAFQENINLVYEDSIETPLFLPPSLAIFFDLYRSSHNLSQAIDNFRNEFAGVRQDFWSLEKKVLDAQTLKERLDMKRQITEVTRLIKSHYLFNDDSALDTIIGFAPEVLNPLSNPIDPSKYSSELVMKPLSWIKDWWRRRPLRHVFHFQKRLHQIANYENLASEILDIPFDEDINKQFSKYYKDYYKLYKSDL